MKITDPSMLDFNESLKLMGFGDVSNISKSFLDYHNLILEWNSKINLISSNTVDSILERHFLDSMSVHLVDSLLNFDLMEDAIDVLDLGTGAGLPGVPLKISHPNWKLTLLDSTSKKIDFLQELCSKLTLKHVNFISDRAENAAHLQAYREKFDLVISRAVADLKVLVELMLPFCKMGGAVVAMKGGKAEQEIKMALNAINVLGGGDVQLVQTSDYQTFFKGSLVVIRKIAVTPENYPRRVGIPHKRPITDLS